MMDFSEKEEVNDILPDTNVDRERTLTGKWALVPILPILRNSCFPLFWAKLQSEPKDLHTADSNGQNSGT
jgi:hypothetical protein